MNAEEFLRRRRKILEQMLSSFEVHVDEDGDTAYALGRLEALDAEYRASQREPNYEAINLHDSAYRMWLEAGSNRRLIKGAIDTMIDGLVRYAETLKGEAE